jgi:hypothetical protein
MGAVAREVVEAYGDKMMEHPVGTGPFRLAEWRRSSLVALEKNPSYRDEFYDEKAPAGDALAQAAAARLKGRKLPMVDRVELSVIEQPQPHRAREEFVGVERIEDVRGEQARIEVGDLRRVEAGLRDAQRVAQDLLAAGRRGRRGLRPGQRREPAADERREAAKDESAARRGGARGHGRRSLWDHDRGPGGAGESKAGV